jgi:hypothetical protein
MIGRSPRLTFPLSTVTRRAALFGAFALAGALWLGAPAAGARDGIALPKPGSEARKSLMDAIRPTFEAEFGAPIEFFVHRLAVWGQFAYASVRPQRPGGKPIDWSKTKYAAEVKGGSFYTEGSAA